MRRSACITALVLALLLPAWADARLHTVAASVPTPLITDDARYAVFGAGTLLDTKLGTQRTVLLDPTCQWMNGRTGFFLVNCNDKFGLDEPYVLRADSGQLFQVPGSPGIDELYFSRIGTHWIGGYNEHSVTDVYLEWRTGRQVGTDVYLDPNHVRNLDSPTLAKLPAKTVASYGRNRLVAPGKSLFPSLFLRRPGHRAVRLDGCYPGGCRSPSIGPNVAVWTRQGVVKGYILATGKRLRWSFQPTVFSLGVFARVTATRIFFNIPLATGQYWVEEDRLPTHRPT